MTTSLVYETCYKLGCVERAYYHRFLPHPPSPPTHAAPGAATITHFSTSQLGAAQSVAPALTRRGNLPIPNASKFMFGREMTEIRGKYRSELHSAALHSMAADAVGARLALRPAQRHSTVEGFWTGQMLKGGSLVLYVPRPSFMRLWSEARLKKYYDLLHNIVLITDVKDSNRLNNGTSTPTWDVPADIPPPPNLGPPKLN